MVYFAELHGWQIIIEELCDGNRTYLEAIIVDSDGNVTVIGTGSYASMNRLISQCRLSIQSRELIWS
jgi:biotin carboxylase